MNGFIVTLRFMDRVELKQIIDVTHKIGCSDFDPVRDRGNFSLPYLINNWYLSRLSMPPPSCINFVDNDVI